MVVMNKMTNIIISLSEPVGLLKESFRDYTALMIHHRHNNVPLMTGALNYDCVPYLRMLLLEIFEMGQNPVLVEYPPSTQMLIRDGLPKEFAKTVAHQVFQITIDALSLIVPNLTFSNLTGYSVDMCGEYDAMVMLPFGYDKDKVELETEDY
jgi:hypothetical protein